MRILKKLGAIVLSAVMATSASAQSFNLDLDVFFGGPSGGEGAPSSTFGAAANQVGYWNQIHAGSPGIEPLRGLDGLLTGVTFQGDRVTNSGGSGGGPNSGDYKLLLDDYAVIPDIVTYRISGLAFGHYKIVTYAIKPNIPPVVAEVTINGTDPKLVGGGPMPGNAFILGLTHCAHEIDLRSSALLITLRNPIAGSFDPYVNGIQIVAVPEPSAVALVGILFYCLRRRKQSTI